MKVCVDKAQKQGYHNTKHAQMIGLGAELISVALPVGDYVYADEKVLEAIKRKGDRLNKMSLMGTYSYSIDSKADMFEVYQNLIGKQHPRFRDECILAMNNHIRLTILIESGPRVMSLEDVSRWRNRKAEIIFERKIRREYNIPREEDFQSALDELREHGIRIRPPVTGEQLAKVMMTMRDKYGVMWEFCRPEDTGKIILERLKEHHDTG